jgi:hypothetical protein
MNATASLQNEAPSEIIQKASRDFKRFEADSLDRVGCDFTHEHALSGNSFVSLGNAKQNVNALKSKSPHLVPKKLPCRRSLLLKRVSRHHFSEAFLSDPVKPFSEITWFLPDWFIPIGKHLPYSNPYIEAALKIDGNKVTYRPILDFTGFFNDIQMRRGYPNFAFKKANQTDLESHVDSINSQQFKTAHLQARLHSIRNRHLQPHSASSGSSGNGNIFQYKKKSKRGGRRIPVSLPSPYAKSSGLPSSPHSLEACIGLLTESERQFCVKTRLDPRVYQNAKETMIKYSKTEGLFRKTAAQKMFRMDVNKTGKIYDFIVLKGWMERPN